MGSWRGTEEPSHKENDEEEKGKEGEGQGIQ